MHPRKLLICRQPSFLHVARKLLIYIPTPHIRSNPHVFAKLLKTLKVNSPPLTLVLHTHTRGCDPPGVLGASRWRDIVATAPSSGCSSPSTTAGISTGCLGAEMGGQSQTGRFNPVSKQGELPARMEQSRATPCAKRGKSPPSDPSPRAPRLVAGPPRGARRPRGRVSTCPRCQGTDWVDRPMTLTLDIPERCRSDSGDETVEELEVLERRGCTCPAGRAHARPVGAGR